ncbi:ABC transporter substrate-binding protein [Acidisoma cellulosilytica]|uniref:ABC transporter substrate-binding protein n=1 Tax=Acidisoma cellulosilyticum TaxID=2802395 RepID=A0A963Z2C8_9PROT|nr:ABC transporter substrate-binding protein [Acidisoma cellulosilyticum]MCB8881331.1 ABC transporter substrate-binding protein [Acidisoma cellulosilyticum]
MRLAIPFRHSRSDLLSRALLSLGLVACSLPLHKAFADDKLVKIGILAQITGKSSADGQESVRGAQMAIDEVNAAGGIDGYKFKLVVGDVKDGSAGDVTSTVDRLLGDDAIQFMLTGYASLTNFELDMMADADMPYMLSATATQTRAIIAPNPSKYACCWSLSPSFDSYGTDVTKLADKLQAEGKVKFASKKVAIISSDNAYSKTISEAMKKTFKADGWTITVDEMVPFGEVDDWRPILAKVRQDPPAVVINADYLPNNSATFLKQFLEQPTNSLLFLQYAPSVPEFVTLTGKASTGVVYDLLGGVLTTPKLPLSAELLAKFKQKYGVESGTYGIALYEEMQVYFAALRKVGDPTNHGAIEAAIGATDMPTAEGHLQFDPKTHLAVQDDSHYPITFFQIWDGKRIMISPAQYATGDFQLPPWMKP